MCWRIENKESQMKTRVSYYMSLVRYIDMPTHHGLKFQPVFIEQMQFSLLEAIEMKSKCNF